MLKNTYIKLLENYTDDHNLIEKCWSEVKQHYSAENRYYHTLQHLENVWAQLNEIRHKTQNWQALLFSLYYHDIVYDSQKTNNEEQSAKLATERMKHIAVPNLVIAQCETLILATKSHFKSTDNDINYFVDADLSILGQPWETYSHYYKNVRREYAIYPDSMYNSGRTKVLNHFLGMDSIFKTSYFIDKHETQARQNIQKELDILSGY